jgi:hypothetical protein
MHAGWFNRQQQEMIENLNTEIVRRLRIQAPSGKSISFTPSYFKRQLITTPIVLNALYYA